MSFTLPYFYIYMGLRLSLDKLMLEALLMDLYERYVDDITKALAPLAPGVRPIEEDMKMVRMPE